jgi:hypothetical protein
MIDSTIQYCQMYDTSSNSPSYHSNFMELHNSGNITFRYNNVYNWQVEGFFFLSAGPSGHKAWYIYGNVFHDSMGGKSGVGRIMELEGGNSDVNGPIYFYNNDVVNTVWVFSGAGSSPGSYDSASAAYNNIFSGNASAFDRWGAKHDYNYFGGGEAFESEANGVDGSVLTPFVDLLGNVFQIASTIGSNYPRNKGTDLGSPYNIDPSGTVRGSDGAWDIGAYEYGATSNPAPPAPTNLKVIANQ